MMQPRALPKAFIGLGVAVGFVAVLLAAVVLLLPGTQAQADGGGTTGEAPGKEPATITPLTLFQRLSVNGDYTAAGVGLRNSTTGNITISLPAGATVNKAYLYYGTQHTVLNAGSNVINLKATNVAGVNIGVNQGTCWGQPSSTHFRADVTSIVTGSGVYPVVWNPTGTGILRQGASLVVVYNLASDPTREVIIMNGNNVVNVSGQTMTTVMTFTDPAAAPVVVKTTDITGDGQEPPPGFAEVHRVIGSLGTLNFDNTIGGGDGAFWDTDTHAISAIVGVGSGSVTVTTGIPAGGDCLDWAAQVLSINSSRVEVDHFPNSVGVFALELPNGTEVTQVLFGPAEAKVQINPVTGAGAVDTDGDGEEQVKTQLVSLQLTGGGFNVTLNPNQPSLGEIEEKVNNTPGILDVDPFRPGDAASFFDIFFVLTGPGLPGPLHNNVPLHIETVITEKPPGSGQTYVHITGPIELLDANNRPSGVRLLSAGHTPVPPPMDHLKCYSVTGPAINAAVTLRDEFDDFLDRVERKTVAKPLRLCNPVTKTVAGVNTGVTNPNTHLKFYQITPLDPTPRPVFQVRVRNQFGDSTFKVTSPVELAVPTQKLPHGPFGGVDHFKCYTTSGVKSVNKVVTLNDQFDLERNLTVTTPFRFCNPVEKTHGDIVTPIKNKEHLVCYKLTRKPSTRNQFGTETLTQSLTQLLCVPSEKLGFTPLADDAAGSAEEAASEEGGQ
jgi:hypothetical protein